MADLTDQQLVFKVLRDVAGDAGVRAIQEARGGMEVLIPLNPKPDHWLSCVLGHGAATEVSRRLTVIDADGRRSCNMEAYVPRASSRLEELRAKIRQEIIDYLLSGMSIRDTALTVRVSTRSVSREKASLIAVGKLQSDVLHGPRKLTMLPAREQALALPAPQGVPTNIDDKRQLWEIRNTIADDGILKGRSTREVSMAAEVSPSYVRIRRKILLASGRLKPGRIGSDGASLCSSPDQSANIGEMVPTPAEVRP